MDIMEIIDKRLNDSGKNWRHVFKVRPEISMIVRAKTNCVAEKALILLDYLLHAGSEAIMSYAKENFYVIKTLKEFQYVDEDGKDQGANGGKVLVGWETVDFNPGNLLPSSSKKQGGNDASFRSSAT